jgi:putative transposase
MNLAYKFRLYPTNAQREILAKTFGCCRFLWNKVRAAHAFATSNSASAASTPAQYKKDFLWLKEVDSLALCNVQLHLEKAYRDCFRKLKKGELAFPKFHSRRAKQSYTTNNVNNSIRIENERLRLPKIGFVNVVFHREIQGVIKSCTISMTPDGKYYVSILTEQEVRAARAFALSKIAPAHTEEDGVENVASFKLVGIDLGIDSFATLSSGEKIENPRIYRKYEERLVLLQRSVSRKKKGSNNRNKSRIKLAKMHQKIANVRNDFLHNLSTKLIRENQIISLETLRVKNMQKNHCLAKSISDASWGNFVKMLEYKGKIYGREIRRADQFFASSKTCSSCGHKLDKLPLKIREWECPHCRTIHDRDVNAAINILNRCNGGDSLVIPSALADAA